MDTDILLRQSVAHVRNSAIREDDNFVNCAILSFNRYSPVLKYGLLQIPKVYDAFTWNSIGPALVTKLSKLSSDIVPESSGQKWSFNVLNRSFFYEISYHDIDSLTETEMSTAEYKSRASSNMGYHFWGKIFYSKQRQIRAKSLMGYALQDTCLSSIMKCVELV